MARVSLLLLAILFALPLGAAAQEVKLPSEVQVLPGAWAIVSPEIVSGGKPKWRIDPALTEVRLDLLFPPEIAKQATGRVFTSVTPGRFRVECWNAKGDVASDIAITWVHVVGTVPTPPVVPPVVVVPPGPEVPPVPPVVAGPRQVLILRESANDTPAMGRLINSLQAGKGREYLKSKGHSGFVLDVDAKGPDGQVPANVAAWKAALNTVLPVLAILDEKGGVIYKTTLTDDATADNVLDILKGHGG